MKKTEYSNEEVIILLASKGDAAAFYSVAAPYFETEYLNLRHNGVSHNDAIEKILPDSSELFRKILGTRPASFGEWFKENSVTVSNQSDEVAIFSAEKNLSAERAHFLGELQLHLLRTASDFNKKKTKKFLLALARNPHSKLIFSAVLIIIAITGAFIFLYTSKSSISISFNTSKQDYSLIIGPKVEKINADTSLLVTILKPDSLTTDSLMMDTIVPVKVEVKIPEAPPVRKIARPRPVAVEVNRTPEIPAVQSSENTPSKNDDPATIHSLPSEQSTVQSSPVTSLPEQGLE